MFKIKTPNPYFNGVRLDLEFVDGVATTDDKNKALDLKSYGYEVEEVKNEQEKPRTTRKRKGEAK